MSRATEIVQQATRAGVTAAAYVYASAVREKLMQGYTSGDFSHGGQGVAGSVTVGDVQQSGDRTSIEVGTNIDYAAFWEFGHFNHFTRTYERVEHWRHAFEEKQDAMSRAAQIAFQRSVGGHGPVVAFRFKYVAPPYQGPVPAPGFRA